MLIYFAWASGILLLIVIVFAARCWRDLHLHYRRINARGSLISSPFGNIQYLTGGKGPAVLVIHGSGGGYDQGELIAEAVLDESFRWIAPSRFGYLKSALPQRASWDDQAHAYACLLDHLEIDKLAVVAMSHGGPSALLFCILHPDRVSSLTLLSCGVAATADSAQAKANKKGKLLKLIYQYDWLYWLISKLFRRQFLTLIGASPTVVARIASQPRSSIGRLIDYMNPVAPRSAGVTFDNVTPLPGNRIAAIQTPTLIIHAQDDSLQLYHNAEFAAATIPTARLVNYAQGGHVVILVEQAEIRSLVLRHIRDHSD